MSDKEAQRMKNTWIVAVLALALEARNADEQEGGERNAESDRTSSTQEMPRAAAPRGRSSQARPRGRNPRRVGNLRNSVN